MAADDSRALARPPRPHGVIDLWFRLGPHREGKNFQVKHAYFDKAPDKSTSPKKPPPLFSRTSPRLLWCKK
jgi:hypothetical protein